MTSLYIWLKFLHIAGLGIFLLGHGVSAGSSLMLRTTTADALRAPLLRLSIKSYVATYPGLLLILVTGVWMGFAGHWWRFGWIWTAIAVLVAVMVVMSALSVPYHKARDAASGKPPGADLETVLKPARPLELAAVGSIGLLVLFFLMVFKPF